MKKILIVSAFFVLPRLGYGESAEEAKTGSNVPWAEGAKTPQAASVEAMIGAKAAPAVSVAAKPAKAAVPAPSRACGGNAYGWESFLGEVLGMAGFAGEMLLFVHPILPPLLFSSLLIGATLAGAVIAPVRDYKRGRRGLSLGLSAVVGAYAGAAGLVTAGFLLGGWLGRKLDNRRK